MNEFEALCQELERLLEEWGPKLISMPQDLILTRHNSQDRNIKQIVGHMVDSASNNTHRIVHLQYRESPLRFPNYATQSNNDRWISIQDYESADWHNLVNLWKYTNLHIAHVMRNVDLSKLNNQWYFDENTLISLREGIVDYLRHFKLHLDEITELENMDGF
jgi:hypothetical protein